jgi:hypothetical protein
VCLTPCAAADNVPSNVVDVLNVTAGTWSTAALSVARAYLAATSLPNLGVAIFAGGHSTCYWFCLCCCMRRCFVRGMHELQECDVMCECECVCVSCLVQRPIILQWAPMLWTF